ncbi:MAG: hypothetical protein QXD29_06225 [Thermoplasmata archaeon]
MKKYLSWYGCIYNQIMKPLGIIIPYTELKKYIHVSISPKQAFAKWLISQPEETQLFFLQQLLIHKPKSVYLKTYLRLVKAKGDNK